jgi:hypothetical protein
MTRLARHYADEARQFSVCRNAHLQCWRNMAHFLCAIDPGK